MSILKPTKLSRIGKPTYSFIQWDFMRTVANLLEHHGINAEIPCVCFDSKRTSRKFCQVLMRKLTVQD